MDRSAFSSKPAFAATARAAAQRAGASNVEARSLRIGPNRTDVLLRVTLPTGRARFASCSFSRHATEDDVAMWAADVVENHTGSYP